MGLTRFVNRHKSIRPRNDGNLLVGCLIALAVVVVIVIIGVIVVAMNWKNWTADATVAIARESINESSLPQSEKPEMIAVIEDFTTRFKDGDITTERFFMTLAEVMASEVFPIGTAYAFDNGYVQASGLTDEEKADGSTQLMRIAQGLRDGDIPRADFEAVFQPAIDQEAAQDASFEMEGERIELLILRDPADVTDEQIKEVIESARTLADDNNVTGSPEMIDLSDALEAEIDASLDNAPAQTPAQDAPDDEAAPAEESDDNAEG